MKRYRSLCFLFIISISIVAFSPISHAGLLGYREMSMWTINWWAPPDQSIDEVIISNPPLEVGIGLFPRVIPGSWTPPPAPETVDIYDGYIVPIFEINGLNTHSVGNIYFANKPQSNIDYVSAILTGSHPDFYQYWGYMYGFGDGNTQGLYGSDTGWEQYAFTDEYNGNGYDFSGYEIDAITLALNDIYYTVGEPYDPGGGDIYTDRYWKFDSTISIYGHAAPVPEPATFILMFIGLTAMIGIGKKRDRRDQADNLSF